MSTRVVKKHGKIIVVIGVMISLVFAYLAIPSVNAAAISNREIRLTDSRPSSTASSAVTYDFEGDHSLTDLVGCLQITFCTTATGACTAPSGMDAGGAIQAPTNWNGWSTTNFTASGMTANVISYTSATTATGDVNYSFSTASVLNPNGAGTYFARAATFGNETCVSGAVDTGVAAFAIVDGVAVSATVAETLTLTLSGVAAADCDTSFGTLDGPASTASTVAFGEVSADTFYHGCQDVYVATNAGSGFTLSGQEQTNLRDTVIGKNISDSTGDDALMTETVSSVWATATFNGFGYTCADQAGATCLLTATAGYRQFACQGTDAECDPGTGSESATTTGVMVSSTATTATSRIQYKLSTSAIQEAGSYSNVIVYIATPVF